MWPAELSAAKVLFFLSRYLALFDVPLAIYCASGSPPSHAYRGVQLTQTDRRYQTTRPWAFLLG